MIQAGRELLARAHLAEGALDVTLAVLGRRAAASCAATIPSRMSASRFCAASSASRTRASSPSQTESSRALCVSFSRRPSTFFCSFFSAAHRSTAIDDALMPGTLPRAAAAAAAAELRRAARAAAT